MTAPFAMAHAHVPCMERQSNGDTTAETMAFDLGHLQTPGETIDRL